MFVRGFPAAAFGTNCWVVAPAEGEQCVVVDPGIGVEDELDAVLREHRLQPVAVLLTHGHLDHTFSVTPVCKPSDVQLLDPAVPLELAGLSLRVDLAPGHTRGSVVFEADRTMFSGDLLFQGSIGRTDLPGGSWEQMQESLARVVLTRGDETVVHCGHGPSTTIGRERVTNPFLQDLAAAPPSRGL